MRRLTACALAMAGLTGPTMAQTPVLTVLTYDSFASEWGPGPAVEKQFEAVCGCDLRYVAAGDGAALLSRLRLEGARTEVDVVVGLDTNLLDTARDSGLFAPHGLGALDLALPVGWEDDIFVPYDWGWFAFVHEAAMADVPANFRALAESDTKIVIQDPRSSTPGLGLILWVKAAYGDEAAALWEDLADNVVTVTQGWSEAYGMFLAGEAEMVLSYTTSPAYHLIAEADDSKAAAPFDEGHYLQIEVAAAVASSDQPALAQQFLDFLLQDVVQSVLPLTNWMYPARAPADGLPAGFDTLITPARTLEIPPSQITAVRDGAVEEWRRALSR